VDHFSRGIKEGLLAHFGFQALSEKADSRAPGALLTGTMEPKGEIFVLPGVVKSTILKPCNS
jgi:hypothetical protein